MVAQAYAVNLMEEYVLRGNSAILKCHIPSFVSEYVTVVSWIISEDEKDVEIKLDSSNNFDGTMLQAFMAKSAFNILTTLMSIYRGNR